MRKAWESYYIKGLHHLESYVPNSEIYIICQDSKKSGRKSFKEWRGIISSLVDSQKTTHAKYLIMGNDTLFIEIWLDANPQIIIETLQEYEDFRKPFADLLKAIA